MAERRKLSPEDEEKVHPKSPDTPMPGRELPLRGAVPTKPREMSVLDMLLQKLGMQDLPPAGYQSPMPGQNPAQGVLDTINQSVMQPARKGMEWLQNLGK